MKHVPFFTTSDKFLDIVKTYFAWDLFPIWKCATFKPLELLEKPAWMYYQLLKHMWLSLSVLFYCLY